jgi:hypothetical protein
MDTYAHPFGVVWFRRRKTRRAMTEDYNATECGVLGPDIRASAQYVRPARCNNPASHKGDHCERRADTFAVLATWKQSRDVRPNRRRGHV